MTHEDEISALSQGYEALNRGDIEGVLELVAADFAWSDPPEVVGARGGSGRSAFALHLAGFFQSWDEFRCEPEEFRRLGDALLVFVREGGRGKLSGAVVEHRLIHVWRFRGGRAVRLAAFVDPAEALEAASPWSVGLAA
ncbi:MAG TPA: nuclear transport factor 2 family protein [Thermoleophilaceae bacterium]|jgi:ketosteroid isomerase-like protein